MNPHTFFKDMKTCAQLFLLFATLAVARAQGTYEGLTSFSSSASSGFVSGTAGWSFTPQISITVTHLGCLDYIVTPQGPVDIGLWTSAGQLLASAVVDATNTLVDVSRYVLLASSVILNSGSAYRLGIWSANGLFLDPVGPGFGGSATVSPDIALGASAVSCSHVCFSRHLRLSRHDAPRPEFPLRPRAGTCYRRFARHRRPSSHPPPPSPALSVASFLLSPSPRALTRRFHERLQPSTIAFGNLKLKIEN